MAVSGEQPNALLVFLNEQAVTVVLDLVNPVRAGGDFRPSGRDAGGIGAGACELDRRRCPNLECFETRCIHYQSQSPTLARRFATGQLWLYVGFRRERIWKA
jgi:hypothetical protein